MRLHIAFVSALCGAVLATEPAVAQDDFACVQRGFERLGYSVGDDAIALKAATTTFIADEGFPMPPLTPATQREWCGVLNSWEQRWAGPSVVQGDPLDYGAQTAMDNEQPGALPRGIHFGDAVPLALRAAIVSDLQWLVGLGELAGGEHLARILGLTTPLSGEILVAWLLEHLSAIAGSQPECRELWIEPRERETDPFSMTQVIGICDDISGLETVAAVVGFRGNVDVEPLTILRLVGDMRVVVPAGEWRHFPVVYLNLSHPLWSPRSDAGPNNFNHLDRLAMLFHEASHVALGGRHYECRFSSPDVFGVWFDRNSPSRCDSDLADSAYLVEGLVQMVLVDNCCDVEYAVSALAEATATLDAVLIPLARRMKVPSEPPFDTMGFAGRTFDAVPPEAYFVALSELWRQYMIREGCPCGQAFDDVTAAIDAMWDLVAAQETVSPWSVSELPDQIGVPPSTDWAGVWLARASRASDSGYNVPLIWVVPCDHFRDPACRTD